MKKELITRTITGLVLVIIIGMSIILGGILFWLTCLLLSTLLYKEFINLYKDKKSFGFFFSTGIIGIIYYLGIYFNIHYILQISLLLILIYGAYRVITKYPAYTYKNIKTTLMGFLYCYVFLSSLYILRVEDNGLYWILFILLVSVFGDVGAYLVGKAIGKRKIAPVLSPGKTLEGLLGGLAFATIVGVIFGVIALQFHFLLAIALSIAIVMIGLMGDLFESHLKREVNIKDTGSTLPGHGGFLDRFDAIIFISGFIYLLLSIFYRGVN
ncbi:MAG: phosphatidate cytidylyltransferase [Fusobacteria bacterium]|nr:phosphatidate cytidylyltransferase [Fusobacteriota bacterium]